MKVSFCITCYDQDAHLLESSLSNILQTQTTKPDEILVVSSGLKSLSCSIPNVKVYNFENRMLAGGARNKGGQLATGDVVCFCDVDDPIHPKKCEVIKRVFDDDCPDRVDALLHNYKFNTHDFAPIKSLDKIEIEKITSVDPTCTNVRTAANLPVCHGHMSARKELLASISYREDMRLGEDGDFCQSVVKSNKFDLYYTPLILINYIT